MEQKNELPLVYAYSDFRIYLKDYYEARNRFDADFTKSYICRKLGLPNSRSYFQDVLNGKTVSDIKIPLFIKLLELDKDEARFFRVLVNFNQSISDPEERELLFDQLISLNRTPKTILQPGVYKYYKTWYHSVIRALLQFIDFSDDWKQLASMVYPPISASQARESVLLLEVLGLIEKDPSGHFRPTHKVITTGAFAHDEYIRQYQIQWLQMVQSAILKKDKKPKRFLTKTISVSEETLKLIEKKIEKFNSELTSMVHKDPSPADRVCHVSLQMFHCSKILKDKNGTGQ